MNKGTFSIVLVNRINIQKVVYRPAKVGFVGFLNQKARNNFNLI